MLGKVYPKDELIHRMHIGSAEHGDKAYELNTLMSGAPLVKSKQTGKLWTISWDELIKLAVGAGIDEPEKGEEKHDG